MNSSSLSVPNGVTVVLDRISIVLRGSFNPSIFQPAWFGHHSLLRDTEAADANIRIVNPQVTQFNTEWLDLQVTRDRFTAVSRNGGYEDPLFDLVLSTFTLLEHTPITALGLNREVKFEFDSTERWHRLGHLLAPKEVWNRVLIDPGLLAMQMQGKRGEPPNAVNVIVTDTGPRKADIDINEHRVVPSEGGAPAALRLLKDYWDECRKESTQIIEHLIAQVA